jgi:glycerophosphoryl diester phosphodiesterase
MNAILLTALMILAPVANLAAAGPPLDPPKHGGVYVVAHRGAHDGIPENTLPAYQKAIDLGVDFVEIDVRTTKDGKFVSIHNETVDAYAGGTKGRIKDMTLDEVRALDVGSRVGPEWKGTKIPTFEEILDLCKGKVGIYIDLKDAAIEKLVPLIKERGMERNIVWYIGGGLVPKLRKECPECFEMPDPGPETGLPALLDSAKPRVVASSWGNLSKTFVEKCHAAKAIVIVDDKGPDTWKPMLEWGVDGIQTDRPADLIKLLGEREKAPPK